MKTKITPLKKDLVAEKRKALAEIAKQMLEREGKAYKPLTLANRTKRVGDAWVMESNCYRYEVTFEDNENE